MHFTFQVKLVILFGLLRYFVNFVDMLHIACKYYSHVFSLNKTEAYGAKTRSVHG